MKLDSLVTQDMCGHKSCAAYDINSLFHFIFILHLKKQPARSLPSDTTREPNLTPEFVKAFSEKLGLSFIVDAQAIGEHVGPEDVFYYAYAIFHSPTYRQRYAEFLKIDFPRLPLTSDRELFGGWQDGEKTGGFAFAAIGKVDDFITSYQ